MVDPQRGRRWRGRRGMNARIIPETVLRLQIEASNPAVSAWVAANAGSGKTHVLAQRVIRLLLGGVEPEKILCITFTKAAAANMAKRVFDTLSQWTALDDARLNQAIRTISSIAPEANVAARFEVLDEAAEAQLLGQATLGVLLDAAADPNGALGGALAAALATAADQTFKEVVGEAIRKRDVVRAWIEHGGNVAGAIAGLCGPLGVAEGDTIEGIDVETTDGPLLPASSWAAVAA